MGRLHIDYDLLTWEGDILRLQFWAHAFEILKKQGTVYLQTEGRLAGCWVMAIDDGESATSAGRASRAKPAEPEDEDDGPREGHRALERHGHLRRQGHRLPVLEVRPARPGLQLPAVCDPRRRPAALGDDVRHGSTTTPGHPAFGGAGTTYNVIDVRQSYLQKLLKQALAAMGHTRQAERSIHFSYEMVALSHATARGWGTRRRPTTQEAVRRGLRRKGWASRPTTSSTCSSARRPPRSPSAIPSCRRRGGADRAARSRWPPCATSWSSTRAARSSRSTSTKR